MGFFARWLEAGWEDGVGAIAYYLHFPPSEIWDMELDEICFWCEQIQKQSDAIRRALEL